MTLSIDQQNMVDKHGLEYPSVRKTNGKIPWLSKYIFVLVSKNGKANWHGKPELCYVELNGDRRKYIDMNSTVLHASKHIANNPWVWLRNREKRKHKCDKKITTLKS